MVHLSVAIGRFVEALLWGIFRVAGGVAAVALVGLVAVALGGALALRLLRR